MSQRREQRPCREGQASGGERRGQQDTSKTGTHVPGGVGGLTRGQDLRRPRRPASTPLTPARTGSAGDWLVPGCSTSMKIITAEQPCLNIYSPFFFCIRTLHFSAAPGGSE